MMGTNGVGRNGSKTIAYEGDGVTLFKPHEIRNGIVLFGRVASTSNGHFPYTVKKRRTGHHRFTYYCSCDGNFLGGYPLCRHIARFKLAEGQIAPIEDTGGSFKNGFPGWEPDDPILVALRERINRR